MLFLEFWQIVVVCYIIAFLLFTVTSRFRGWYRNQKNNHFEKKRRNCLYK